MTMTTISRYPLSLREHLDSGGRATDFPYFVDWMVETVVEARDPELLRRRVEQNRKPGNTVDQEIADRTRRWAETMDEVAERNPQALAQMREMGENEVVWLRWEDELVRDAEFRDRVAAQLPADAIAEHQRGLDAEERPYRLVVRHLPAYRCAVTGEEMSGPAIVIEGTAGWVRDAMEACDDFIFSPDAVEAVLRRARLT